MGITACLIGFPTFMSSPARARIREAASKLIVVGGADYQIRVGHAT
jgi:hypothetical protein